jgi:hypothetical protein
MPSSGPLLGSTTHTVNVEVRSILPDLIIANVVTLVIVILIGVAALVYYRLTRPPAERPVPLMLRDPVEPETVVHAVEERLPNSVESQ